jgi:FtsH-binding integral membrane protein
MARMPSPFGPSRPYEMQYESAGNAAIIGRFFNAVYAWMAAGLALTAVVAWWMSTRPDLMMSLGRGGFFGLLIAQFVLVIAISAATERISAGVATVLFLIYAAMTGVTLSGLFYVYTQATLAGAFVVTAGMFGAMSLYGMFTRRDLSGWGSMLFMALIGLILAMIVSVFWHNSVFATLVNFAGVLIFVGLTAYDTQMLKYIAVATANDERMAARLSINGALRLYLDFLNLFLMLLRLMGNRRS